MKNILEARIASFHIVVISTILISAAVALHYINIHHSVVLSFMAMAALKLVTRWRGYESINRWAILAIAIIGFFNSVWRYGPPLGRDSGVSFLIVLLGLKILESRTSRDARIVVILGYFIVVTHFFYFTTLPVVIFLFSVVLALTWLMVQLGHVEPHRFLRADLATTSRMVIQAIPFALILFFLFPRFAGTFWLLQSPASGSVTGMSDTLSMGGISSLAESSNVAFTATFEPEDPVPPQRARYWRAGVLWDTDGQQWIHGPRIKPLPIALTGSKVAYRYEVRLENDRERWLYALELPLEGSKGSILSPELCLRKRNAGKRVSRYTATSGILLNNRTLGEQQVNRGLGLPADRITTRMRDLAGALEDGSTIDDEFSPSLYAQRILQFINANDFEYTLRPPPLNSASPVDEFLFRTRRGFCEHYAASVVTLLRMAGIPSRLVIGYLGGEHNPLTNQIQVRQSDAHAWTEYWDPAAGWIRLDPTAAVAPERIENPIDLASSFADGSMRYVPLELGPVARIVRGMRWYSAWTKFQWEKWFVGFDQEGQTKLLRNIGLGNVAVQSVAGIAFVVGLVVLMGCALWFHKRDRLSRDRAWVLYNRYCHKLGHKGLLRHPSEGPEDYLRRSAAYFPDSRVALENVTRLYVEARYGPTDDAGETLGELRRAIRNLQLKKVAT